MLVIPVEQLGHYCPQKLIVANSVRYYHIESVDTEESVDSFQILNIFVCGCAYAVTRFERNVTYLYIQVVASFWRHRR